MSSERGPLTASNDPPGVEGASRTAGRGKLIVVCAPSGAGKSSLVEMALERIERLRYSISYTTRASRGVERDGINYFFIGEEEFRAMRERGEFLESAEVHGNLYGTCRSQVERLLDEGLDVILDIDVQGADLIRRQMSDAVTIFILPPSREMLERRLRLRNLNDERDMRRRIRNAAGEVRMWKVFDYVIVNDNLDRAYMELEAIIIAERCRPDRQEEHIRGIIATFEGE
jgi:guanylate kinase